MSYLCSPTERLNSNWGTTLYPPNVALGWLVWHRGPVVPSDTKCWNRRSKYPTFLRGAFPKWEVSKNRWSIMENPIKHPSRNGWFGVTPILGNHPCCWIRDMNSNCDAVTLTCDPTAVTHQVQTIVLAIHVQGSEFRRCLWIRGNRNMIYQPSGFTNG